MSDYDENEEAPWYPYRDRIRDVVIESGVTHIGAWSFYNTGAPIFRVNIPDSVKTIGSYAFAGAKLSSVEIPDSVVTIGDYAFTSCVSLEKVTIGNHVKTIGNGAFQRNTALKSVIIPDSVESIEEYAFKDCINLQFVYLKENLKSIGSGAFYNTGIISITIPDSVEEIGSVAFYYCTTLSKAELGSGVKIIGQKAFYATNLSTVTIPENVTNIGGMAFGFHTGEEKDTSFIIRGKSGTAAEFYADDNSFIFKPISYDVWLAGTQITVDNIDILTPVIAQNSSEAKERFKNGEMEITFDGKSTLTLKNAIIDTGTKTAQGATFGIKGLNIVVEGDCRIIGREVNGIKLTQNATITGGGTLTVTGKSSGISYDGDGDIELTVDKTALNVSGSIGINGGSSPSGKKLTINCSDVTADGSNSAINYLGEITLNDAEIITPKGGEIKSSATWDGSPSLGIYDGSTLSKKAVIAAKPNAQTMIGDVNGDGKVTIDDATMIQKAVAELVELDDTQKKAADTNGDGNVTIDDAISPSA